MNIPKCVSHRIAQVAPTADPRHVYAWMLDAGFSFGEVTRARMDREIRTAASLALMHPRMSDSLASSYGI